MYFLHYFVKFLRKETNFVEITRPTMKRFAVLCVLMTFALCAWGQDYLSRGKSYYANGNYSDAISQFEAQLAYLDTRNISKNSDEYIAVEKLLAKAKTCLPLSRKAKTAFTDAEKAGTEEAYNAAIDAYDKLLKQNSSDRNALAMKKKCQTAITTIAYEREAATAWAQVDLGEISSIEAFIAKYPDSQHVAEAKQQITDINDNIVWGNATSKEDYQKYLVDYPKGLHKEDAEKYIEHWDETVLWKNYSSQNTQAAYNEYLAKYPNGLFVNDARQGIKNIQDDEAWATAVATNTLKSYQTYSYSFPSGRHKDEAQKKKAEFEALQKKERDAANAFAKAPSLNGLRNFENTYPNSEFKSTVYDTYASFLCDQININSCKKSDFKEAMSYAQTQNTKNKINAKEQEWKNLKSTKSSQAVGKVIGYVLVGGAIVAGIIAGVTKNSGSN